jgi:hypothetical protein
VVVEAAAVVIVAAVVQQLARRKTRWETVNGRLLALNAETTVAAFLLLLLLGCTQNTKRGWARPPRA